MINRILVTLICAVLCGGCGAPAKLSVEDEVARESQVRLLLARGVQELRAADDESFNRAEAAFLLAKELSGNDPRVLDGLGCVALRRGILPMAEYYFRRAIEVDRNYSRPVAHLALVAEARGDTNAARGLLQLAISMNPLNYRARVNRAALEMRQGGSQGDQARAYADLLEAYKQIGQEDPIITHNLSLVREQVSSPNISGTPE